MVDGRSRIAVPLTELSRVQASGLAALVGNTPLLHLTGLSREAGIPIYAKAEWFNPGGSVKDRPARHILLDAIARGALGPTRPGRRLLDATSGNTGIAYATLAAALQVPVTLCLPANASPERQMILRAFGVEIILTDPLDGSDGAILRARELAAADPERFHYVDQYGNAANWTAHFETTGPEIWEATQGRVTHFVAGLGTTGTLVGVSRYLKSRSGDVQAVAVVPDGPLHGLEGLKDMETAIVPPIWDPSAADATIHVKTEDAQAMVKRLAREEGLLLGPSGGAAAVATLRLAKGLSARHDGPLPDAGTAPTLDSVAPGTPVMVTLFPDNASKYLTARFWEEDGA